MKSTAKTIDINERDSGIKILLKIANLSIKCFQSFMESLLELIELMSESSDDKNRIAFIIRQICEIRGEEVYSSIAELLLSKKSKSTIRLMNILLATAPQLHSVRVSLREEQTPDNEHNNDKKTHLFEKLWDAWIFCPVSSICLALISGRYNLAYKTLKFISTQNILEEDLVEFDRLIQLIESPGFTPLRFELLERPPVLTGTHIYMGCLDSSPNHLLISVFSDTIWCAYDLTTIKIIRSSAAKTVSHSNIIDSIHSTFRRRNWPFS